MWTILRKLGLMGLTFFVANALAAIVSVAILFVRTRRVTAPMIGDRCPVCGAGISGAAKYCSDCGSRV